MLNQLDSVVRILIVTSRFNYQITHALQRGCCEYLREKAGDADIKSVWVPGAFEIPVVVARALDCAARDAVICLGAIIRGETRHFELLATEVTRALMQLSVAHRTPLIFEVLAAENMQQAQARCGLTGKHNKGVSAAQTALAMIATMHEIET